MNASAGFRLVTGLLHSVAMVFALAAPSSAAPTFISHDPRLPNPDRPYVMTDRVNYGPIVGIDDLTISVANSEQLDTPAPNSQGNWEFDSTFDVNYSAILSVGLAPPVFVTGTGRAHAVGVAPGGGPIFAPLVYDTELLALDLDDPPGFRFRESPVLRSTGVTTVEDLCLACGAPFPFLRISSYFDVFSEVSIDGGTTWIPASGSFRIEQIPEPATIWLVPTFGVGIWAVALRRKRPRARGAG
jgi:hypothetical protein